MTDILTVIVPVLVIFGAAYFLIERLVNRKRNNGRHAEGSRVKKRNGNGKGPE